MFLHGCRFANNRFVMNAKSKNFVFIFPNDNYTIVKPKKKTYVKSDKKKRETTYSVYFFVAQPSHYNNIISNYIINVLHISKSSLSINLSSKEISQRRSCGFLRNHCALRLASVSMCGAAACAPHTDTIQMENTTTEANWQAASKTYEKWTHIDAYIGHNTRVMIISSKPNISCCFLGQTNSYLYYCISSFHPDQRDFFSWLVSFLLLNAHIFFCFLLSTHIFLGKWECVYLSSYLVMVILGLFLVCGPCTFSWRKVKNQTITILLLPLLLTVVRNNISDAKKSNKNE